MGNNEIRDNNRKPSNNQSSGNEELKNTRKEVQRLNEALHKTQKELEIFRSRYSDLFNNAPIGYLIINKDYSIQDVNNRGAEMLNISKNKLKATAFTRYIHPDSRDAFCSHMKDVIGTGEDKYCEVKLIKKAGEVIYVNLESTPVNPLKDHDDTVTHEAIRTAIIDITDQKEKDKINRRLIATVNSSHDAIISASKDVKILSWNKGAERMYGYKAEEVIGKEPDFLIPEDRKGEIENYLKNIFQGQYMEHFETVRIRKDGKPVNISLSVSPVYNENNEIIAAATIGRDITEQKYNEKKLRESEEKYKQHLLEAKERAEESDRLKSAFLANMSHEIRTPMNGILGFTQLLLSRIDYENDELKYYLDTIYDRGEHLLQIINDIIDISKIEANQLKIVKKDFYLNDLLHELYHSYEVGMEKNKNDDIQLDLVLGFSRENSFIHSDKVRLQQILANLLSNALKFTEKGEIVFGYKKWDPETLLFFVRDTGIGIPGPKQKEIFDRFRQAEEGSASRNYEGTGLGLSISENLVRMLNGTIWVESEEGQGSVFYFTLPLEKARPQQSPEPPNEMGIRNYNLESKKILVVEDDPVSQNYLKEILNETGAEMIFTDNGTDAFQIFSHTSDLSMILMDIKLPDKNGDQVTREIRKENSEVPIIAQTAYAMHEDRAKTLEAGCTDYITKPIDPKALLALMNKYLKKTSGN